MPHAGCTKEAGCCAMVSRSTPASRQRTSAMSLRLFYLRPVFALGTLSAMCALVLPSCGPEWHADYFDAGGSHGGVYASSGWSNSLYDASGFPIYGYYDGRPVYGYSSSGVPIFSFSLLTSSCYVPSWSPAPYYCGHWSYPHHVCRRPLPPRYPHHHHPGMRPPANHPHHVAPDRRPGTPHQPGYARPNHPVAGNRPHRPGLHRPDQPNHVPGSVNRPNGRPHIGNRPGGGQGAAQKPSYPPSMGPHMPGNNGWVNHTNRPNGHPSGIARPGLVRPGNNTSRPTHPSGSIARPSSPGSGLPRPSRLPSPRPPFPASRPSVPSFSAPRPSPVPAAAPSRPSFSRTPGHGSFHGSGGRTRR